MNESLNDVVDRIDKRLERMEIRQNEVKYAAFFSVVGATLLGVGFAMYNIIRPNNLANANQKFGWVMLALAGFLFILQSASIYLSLWQRPRISTSTFQWRMLAEYSFGYSLALVAFIFVIYALVLILLLH